MNLFGLEIKLANGKEKESDSFLTREEFRLSQIVTKTAFDSAQVASKEAFEKRIDDLRIHIDTRINDLKEFLILHISTKGGGIR